MEGKIKLACSFFLGTLVGGGVTYFVSKKKFEKRLEAEFKETDRFIAERSKQLKESLTEEMLKSSKDAINSVYGYHPTDDGSNDNGIDISESGRHVKETVELLGEYVTDEDIALAEAEDDMEDDALQYVESMDVIESDPNKQYEPYEITEAEYAEEYVEEYLKACLVYYPDEDLLEDQDGSPLDPDYACGKDVLHKFFEYEEIDILYARNDVLRIDYMIERKD